MKRVLVYRRKFLAKSETFIYQQLIGHKQVKPAVLTRSRPINRRQFPFSPIYVRRSFKGLVPWLRKKKIKCLHARFGTAGVEILPIARRAKLPLIVSFHGFDATKLVKQSSSYRMKLRRLFRHAAAVTVVSNHMKRRLIRLGCPAHKITLIRSGINLQKFPYLPTPPVKDGKYRILSVGRLTEKKGMNTLIKAFRKVHEKYPQARLTIVGEGEERRKLKKLVRRLRLKKQVTFTGALPHDKVREQMEKCHLFVIACKTAKDGNQEGIPNVLMEAMATGRPVVSTYHAGIPELIEHGKHGYLVPEGASTKLAKMITTVLEEQENWPVITTLARERVEQQHDIEKQREILERLYLQVLKKAR
ncbi:glycosyltransferase [Brevibacillus migulae]